MASELPVGRAIADVVVASWGRDLRFPQAPLTVKESVLLALLRAHGTAVPAVLAAACGVRPEALRPQLARLLDWGLVRRVANGNYVSASGWTKRVRVSAVEAKLTDWRHALVQACSYAPYADGVYVALPAHVASRIDVVAAARAAKVGLLAVASDSVIVKLRAPALHAHDWRREFALSRVLTGRRQGNAQTKERRDASTAN